MSTEAGSSVPRRVPRARIAVVCLLLFCLLAVLVKAGWADVWDLRLEALVQSFRTPPLDQAMVLATYLCSWQVIVAGATLTVIFFLALRRWLLLIALLVSLLGNQLIVSAIKSVFVRARPDQLQALLPATGASFPSGHTFSAFAFYGLLALLVIDAPVPRAFKRPAGVAAVLLIAAVGVSRVYVGAHWPSDVLGSCLLGIAWLGLIGVGMIAATNRWPVRRVTTPTAAAGRWALLLFLIWLIFVAAFEYLNPSATQSEALAFGSDLFQPFGDGMKPKAVPDRWGGRGPLALVSQCHAISTCFSMPGQEPPSPRA